MDENTHLLLAALLRKAMTDHVIDGTSTILGLYHQAPAFSVRPMHRLGDAFGGNVAGTGEYVGKQLEHIAQQIQSEGVHEETASLIGVAFILEVHFEQGPRHLLTSVCADQGIHWITWSRDESEPRGIIVLPGTVEVRSDPFVDGLRAILHALNGGER